MIVRQRLPHAGVIFFRLGEQDFSAKVAWLERLLTDYTDRLDQFLVVTERGVRVRQTS